jgi:hypothetical protein
VATTPQYSFITPDLCSDGHDETCADPRQKGGYEGIDEFLREWVPRILASPAYKHDGLLIVTFAEAADDASACCDEPAGPNAPRPGIDGPGGGRVGAVLLSPFIKPGTRSDTAINHYGYLRSIEDLFGLPHLGFAGQDGLRTFQSMQLFTQAPVRPRARPPKPIRAFSVRRRGRRLTIRLRLAPGIVGRVTVSRRGRVVQRFVTGGTATFRVEVRRKAKVVLRAQRRGRTVRRVSRRR